MVLEQYISNDYLRSVVIAIIILVVARIFVSILFSIIKNFTKKTRTDIDDIIMKKATSPLTIIIFLFAIKIPLAELPLNESIELIVSRIISSVVVVVLAYLTYILF